MINKLTSEQEKQLQVYRDKWVTIGLSTNRIDRKVASENFMIFNKIVLGKEKRPIIIFMNSPLTAWIATLLLYDWFYIKNNTQVESQVESQVRSQVGSQVWSQVESQVESQVRSQVRSQVESQVRSRVRSRVRSQVRSQVGSQVWSQVGSQVESQVRSRVWSQVESQVRSQVESQVGSQVESQVRSRVWSQVESQVRSQNKNFVYPYLCGNFDSSYFSFYNFCNEVLKIKFDNQKKWNSYLKTSDVNLIYPFDDFWVVSEKPTNIKIVNSVLHNEKGAAIFYADGFSIYSLNGVKVPQWLVETPAEKIDPTLALKETNADIQREIIRKIGAERMLKKCNAKIIDDWIDSNTGYNYKLMEMAIGQNIRRKYLYYEHASMKGIFYAKPVPPETKKAIHGRAYIVSLVEREELNNIDVAKEAEIISNLPLTVS